MKLNIEIIRKLEAFSKKLLTYINLENIHEGECIKFDDKKYYPDLVGEKGNRKYIVEIKSSFRVDSGKVKGYVERFRKLQSKGYENILIIYDEINPYIKKSFTDVATILDISNILYIIKDNPSLTYELLSIINYSVSNIDIVKPNIPLGHKKISLTKEKTKEEALISIPSGTKYYREYENFCIKTLKYLFLDYLALWSKQNRTDEGLNIFDLICRIKNNTSCEFFSILETYFKSKYIIFEFKNYSEKITQNEVITTNKYLYDKALRSVGIILSRKGIDENGMKQIKGLLRNEGKLILNLDDTDLLNMLKLKESGEDPTIILMDKLDYLLTNLEK